jgi:hypothetical protein
VTDRANDRFAATRKRSALHAGTAIWIALISGLTVLGSFAFACAAPLAAVAALAALKMERSDGVALVTLSWLANQIVGFALLSYPHTIDSYAWGAAIGLSAVLGFFAARAATQSSLPQPIAVAFVVSFAAYQAGLYAAGIAFSYEGDAFSTAVVAEIFAVNFVAYVGFMLVHRAAIALSLLKPARPVALASTA